MLDQEQRLRLSIQKGGRLGVKSEELLQAGELKFKGYTDKDARLYSEVSSFPLDIYFDRDDDIADNVEAGIVELGIVGQNIVKESKSDVVELMKLGFGKCKLVVAAPPPITQIEQLNKKRIVTSYPNSTEEFFGSKNLSVQILERSGSIEGYASRGIDGIVDIIDTGKTMREAGIFPLAPIFESEAVLIANPNLKSIRGSDRVVRSIVRRILSVQRAEGQTMIALNSPSTALNKISERIPGLTAPTVSELTRPGWVAVSAVVPKSELNEIVDDLQEFGAEGVIEEVMTKRFPDRNDAEVINIMTKLYN